MEKIYNSTIEKASNDNLHSRSVLKAVFSLLLNDKRVMHKVKNFNLLFNPSLPLQDKEKICDALKKDMYPDPDLNLDLMEIKKTLRDFNVSFGDRTKNPYSDLELISLATKIKNDPYFVFLDYLNKYLSSVKKIEICRESQNIDLMLKAPKNEKQELLEYKEEVLKIASNEKKLIGTKTNLTEKEEKNIDDFLVDCVDDRIEEVEYISEFDKLFDNYEKQPLNEVIEFINYKKKFHQVSTIKEAGGYLNEMRLIIKRVSPKLLIFRNDLNERLRNILESIGGFDLYREYKDCYKTLEKELVNDTKLSPDILLMEVNREVSALVIEHGIEPKTPEYNFATKYMNEDEKDGLVQRINAYGSVSERVDIAKRIEIAKQKALINN